VTHASDLSPGSLVAGKYEILDVLGRGGSATVYRAKQAGTATGVALKVMHEEIGDGDGVGERERFAREAELVQSLRHPNIVRLLDYGYTEQNLPYLAFALLVGRSLEQRLHDEGGLEWLEVGRLCAQVLRALEKAHAREIVHRDIKPGNIFLVRTPLGEVAQVLDFGLAKVVQQSSENELTRVGSVLGTPRYLSPEQARGEPVGQAADIYSLGLVMAEMLSGRPVVQGNTHFEMFVVHGSDRPHELPVEVLDSPFAAIIRRAIDKQPSVRYRLASQMLADVEAAISRLEDWQEGDGEGDEGDFVVTKMLDPAKALQTAQGSAASEQLRRAFNLLARKSSPGGATAALRAAARPAAEGSGADGPPTERPSAAAERPTRPPRTEADDPAVARGPAPSVPADAEDDEEQDVATSVADLATLGLVVAPGAATRPGAPAAAQAAQPRPPEPAPPPPLEPVAAAAPIPTGPAAGAATAEHTTLIDTTAWPAPPPLGAAGVVPSASASPDPDLGATAFLSAEESPFAALPAARPGPMVMSAPAATAASGPSAPSAWAATSPATMVGPSPSALQGSSQSARWIVVVVALLLAIAAGAALRLLLAG
jgi:serine/threonine-protein kinase